MRFAILPRRLAYVAIGVLFLAAATCMAQSTQSSRAIPDFSKQKVLYMVGYAHLDTQWRWSYPQVIAEFLRKTMEDNFRLFEKYPHYIFNFTGANRYMLMKEYFPEDFQKLKKYVAQGRWFPDGSSMEEGDANMPSGEALIRQVLYGNEFFRKEFGTQSTEFMLPDCFGFQASLPSILAHCGIEGFSTQKLSWGSAVGIPFNVGVWVGPDGRGVVAALNPLSYTTLVTGDLSYSPMWLLRLQEDFRRCGLMVDYGYYGTGDRGGAPSEDSVAWIEKSVTSDGPIHVISSRADQMFVDLSPQQISRLPKYQGDLLLTNHSAGSLTSQAYVKRWNRKNEELADAAERASVAADWLGSAPYPREKLADAWRLVLGAHFHDTMAGTMIPKAYEYTWNNMVLALNQFAAVAQDACGAVIKGMDTRGQGISLVVYNALSIEREDVVGATINFPARTPMAVSVFGPDGIEVPSQIIGAERNALHILFLAKVPSLGFAVYDVRDVPSAHEPSELKIGPNLLEDARFRVTVNSDGDIVSIFDKQNHREALSSPIRLEFLHENPKLYPAWNMDWRDRQNPPRAYVTGPANINIVESGPARVCLEITRLAQGSKFVQRLSLAGGDAGDRLEIDSKIDWQTQQCSLESQFPLSVSNPMATYQSQSAAVERGNNNPLKFEVPQQQWLDLDSTDGSYGVGILNDCKYGSDKPSDKTVRLTLLYTPEADSNYQDQATQDIGRHEMLYALAPHAGSWQQGRVPWLAARLNQPLIAFQCPAHEGPLGRTFSMMRSSTDQVGVIAMKKAEDSDRIVVRLNELQGQDAGNVQLEFSAPIAAADELDGQEREIRPAAIQDGRLVFDIQPFGLRTFSVKLAPSPWIISPPVTRPLDLACNLDAVSSRSHPADGAFDEEGRTYAGEAWPSDLSSEGIPFKLGSAADGMKNAVACDGQEIAIPVGFDKIYLLAAALDGDQTGEFVVGGQPTQITVQDWGGYIGQWDNRLWSGVIPALTYNWTNKFAGLTPGYIKRDTVAWFCSHRHHPVSGNEYYRFSYLFKYALDLPSGPTSTVLPRNSKIRVFAATVAGNGHDDVRAARPLYDTLEDHAVQTPPSISPSGGKFNDATWITIAHPLYWHEGGLHYTTDGSEPTANSPVYSGKFLAVSDLTVRAREFDTAGHGGPEASDEFEVTDVTPPSVKSVSAISVIPEATIEFSEPVQKTTAETPSNYRFDPPAVVKSAALSEDGQSVKLTLSRPLIESRYHLTITGVTDVSPSANSIAHQPMNFDVEQPVYSASMVNCPAEATDKTVQALPIRSKDHWTVNMFVRVQQMPEDRTIIAGFGQCESAPDGVARYLSVFARKIHFWSANRDVETASPLIVGQWQMLTASYDGNELRVYKNGHEIGRGDIDLIDDKPVVRLAPIDPWEKRRLFHGQIRDMTIWNSTLLPETLAAIYAAQQ
jgi:alpha-mannosidase